MGLMLNMMRQIGDERKAKGELRFNVTWAEVELLEQETLTEIKNSELNGIMKGVAYACLAYVCVSSGKAIYNKIKSRKRTPDSDSILEESNG